MTLTPWNVAIGVILLCGIACDLHAQAAVHRFGSPLQRRLPQTIITSSQSPTPTKELSKADIAIAIENDIDNERKKSNDKKFHVNYRGKDLALALIRIHDDPLSSLGGGKYFACADMKAADSIIYDIDFFIAGQSGSMKVTGTSVHKVNGKSALQLERRRRRVEKAAASLKAGTVALPLWWAGHCATLD
jgi:hypothetical protein